jgi:hypothetical protein
LRLRGSAQLCSRTPSFWHLVAKFMAISVFLLLLPAVAFVRNDYLLVPSITMPLTDPRLAGWIATQVPFRHASRWWTTEALAGRARWPATRPSTRRGAFEGRKGRRHGAKELYPIEPGGPGTRARPRRFPPFSLLVRSRPRSSFPGTPVDRCAQPAAFPGSILPQTEAPASKSCRSRAAELAVTDSDGEYCKLYCSVSVHMFPPCFA